MDKNLNSTICSVYFWHICDLKQSQGHQTCNENVDHKHGYNNAKFERSRLNSVWGKGNGKDFFKQGSMSIASFEVMCSVVLSWSAWHKQQSYSVSTYLDKNIKFPVEILWHCYDLEIQSRSLKVVWMGKAQWVLPPCTVWHLHIYTVWENHNL